MAETQVRVLPGSPDLKGFDMSDKKKECPIAESDESIEFKWDEDAYKVGKAIEKMAKEFDKNYWEKEREKEK